MDWAKAKIVLIIAFLVTNIFLGYNLYLSSPIRQNSLYSDDYREYVDSLLDKKDIELKAKMSQKESKMGPVTIKYEEVDTENLRNLFIEKDADLDIVNEKKLLITIEEEKLEHDEDSAIDYSNEFIKEYGYDRGDIMFERVETIGHFIKVSYSASYKGFFLEKSYMNFYFYPDGAIRIERLWMSVIDDNFQRKTVITPLEAIVQLYAELEKGSIIEDVELGYYFKLGEDMKIRSTKTAKAFPAWRITLSDGTEKYVYALDL